jgi:hypothetical protein
VSLSVGISKLYYNGMHDRVKRRWSRASRAFFRKLTLLSELRKLAASSSTSMLGVEDRDDGAADVEPSPSLA